MNDSSVEEININNMRENVEFKQQSKAIVYDQATKFTDEAYKTMFVKPHTLKKVNKDEYENLTPGQELSKEERENLQPSADGMVHVADNGIFNGKYGDDAPAEKYANQHGTVEGPQYYIHFPQADSGLSELLIAGYQKYIESDFWGLTNSTKMTEDIMLQYGATGLHFDGHSRGSMTIGNALESISGMDGTEGSLLISQ
ncbi:hypothetical protein ACQEPX_001190 [Xanthomonas oryzae pv. oryzicola]|uniref:hypothetical protein n=2 Tax=Xanthomonas oryzae TaxID=347 RepID=UPI003DA02AC0